MPKISRQAWETVEWLVALAGALLSLAAVASSDDSKVLVGGSVGQAVRRAVDGAALRLERTECSAVLSDFRDAEGRTLQSNLDALGLGASQYVRHLFFLSGARLRRCECSSVLGGLTVPGSRVVLVCPRFAAVERRAAEVFIIHEMLHSLELGENPPSSGDINRRVMERCGR